MIPHDKKVSLFIKYVLIIYLLQTGERGERAQMSANRGHTQAKRANNQMSANEGQTRWEQAQISGVTKHKQVQAEATRRLNGQTSKA